ncbi:MAG: elongation factor P [Patescibacteria group bacterium]|nr:elongation factor P [Patescibacteria group bacterium]MCL5224308.1 elongation factor P [Patescibacteria group bacterium]
MLSYTELKKGVIFALDGEPYEVVDSDFLRMQQRKAVVRTKIRNLISGKLLDRTWQASDYFEEVEVEKKEANFIYTNRGEYWFSHVDNPKERFKLSGEAIKDQAPFLKPNTKVTAWLFKDEVIRIEIPIKMEFEVVDAPPAIKGNTAQGGTKLVTIEGGAKISVPLFVNSGDLIKINTQTQEYVERVEKR